MRRKSSLMYNVRFWHYQPHEATDKDGVDCCPKCQSRNITFLDEEVQLGFGGFHKYFVFNECDDCAHHFAFVMVKRGELQYDR